MHVVRSPPLLRDQVTRCVRLIALVPLSVLVASCGGGGGNGSPGPAPVVNQSVGGIWKGQFTTPSGVSVVGLALVADDGSFYSEAKNSNNGCADIAKGNLTTSGSTVSGSAQFAIVNFTTVAGVQANCTFPDGSTWGTETISGSVVQRSTLTLTGNAKTANGTALASSTVLAAFDSLSYESSSLTKVAGNSTGPTGDVLTISGIGAISDQDPASGFVLNGKVSTINASYHA